MARMVKSNVLRADKKAIIYLPEFITDQLIKSSLTAVLMTELSFPEYFVASLLVKLSTDMRVLFFQSRR